MPDAPPVMMMDFGRGIVVLGGDWRGGCFPVRSMEYELV